MYDYKLDFYQNMLTITILIVTYIIIFIVGSRQKNNILIVTLIVLWHTFFSLVYFIFSLYSVSDAKGYYTVSITEHTFSLAPGTAFLNFLTSVFTQGIGSNYLNTALIFNIAGSLGLVLLYLSIKDYLKNLPWYYVLIVFIPSMSFWSASLSKDSISFFAVCLFLYAIATNRKPSVLIPMAFLSMFMVRPHIAAMFLASYVVYFILKAKVHILFKLLTVPFIMFGLLLSVSFVESYIGLEDGSAKGYTDYINQRETVSQVGGSSVDISSMSYPMKIFTYMFRPLPFEAHNLISLINSFENTVLLLFTIYILFKSKFNLKPFFNDKNLWLFTYLFLTSSVLALTTANLGIATRQKWMFMPVFLYLLIYALYDYKVRNTKVRQ